MATLKNGSISKRLEFIQKRLPQVRERAITSTLRGIVPEAARKISSDVLNLAPRQISPYVSARVSKANTSIVVGASKQRLPLLAFKPRVSARDGVTVTTWKDRGAQVLPHAFKRKDGKPGIWQRIPYTGAKFGGSAQTGGSFSGLVSRLPIVERKGPSMHRIFQARHGDIVPALTIYAQARLATEVQRMMKAGL